MLGVGMCFYNPYNFEKMNENLVITCNHLLETHNEIWLIELIYEAEGLNQVSIKDRLPKNVNVIEVRAESLLWHKEQLLNILAREAIKAKGYDAFAVFDGDILFPEKDWLEKINTGLEKNELVQCYSKAEINLARDGSSEKIKMSALHDWFKTGSFTTGTPGGAWAMRKEFWLDIGLFEYNIIGGGDTAFVSALVNRHTEKDYWENLHKRTFSISYLEAYRDYRKRLNDYCDSVFYYIEQEAYFQEHGTRSNRHYFNRHKALEGLNLVSELTLNKYGLFEWHNTLSARATFISNYFRVRNSGDDKTNLRLPCECVRKCIANGRLYGVGEKAYLPFDKMGRHFKVSWG